MNIPCAVEGMRSAIEVLDTAHLHDDLAAQMSSIARLCRIVPDLTIELVERGVAEGMTQRRMASLLEIPESALRGARREFAA